MIYFLIFFLAVQWGSPVHIPDRWRMCTISYSIPRWRTDQLWSVPKLENDILRRNASKNGRKTDLIERYILHRNPKHTIYVRYFSILLYLLNVQVAPTENKTSLKLWWRISLNVLSWQDSDKTRKLCHFNAIHYNWKRRFFVKCFLKNVWGYTY
jgi:hypothetical protein